MNSFQMKSMRQRMREMIEWLKDIIISPKISEFSNNFSGPSDFIIKTSDNLPTPTCNIAMDYFDQHFCPDLNPKKSKSILLSGLTASLALFFMP